MIVKRVNEHMLVVTIFKDEMTARGIDSTILTQDPVMLVDSVSDLICNVAEELGIEGYGSAIVDFSYLDKSISFIYESPDPIDYDSFGYMSDDSNYDDFEWVVDQQDMDFDPKRVNLFKQIPFIFEFSDIEDVIRLAYALKHLNVSKSRLIHHENKYHLILENINILDRVSVQLSTITSEYGNVAKTPLSVLEEYGKTIYENNALGSITKHFKAL